MKKTILTIILCMVIINASVVVSASGSENIPSNPDVTVTLIPPSPETHDNLVCNAEGGSRKYSYYWYKNGERQTDLSSNTVPSSQTTPEEIWKCSVKDLETQKITNSQYVTIQGIIEEETHDLKITNIVFTEQEIMGGDYLSINLELDNKGNVDEENTQLTFEVNNLKISDSVTIDKILAGKKESVNLDYLIPECANSGSYTLKLEMNNEIKEEQFTVIKNPGCIEEIKNKITISSIKIENNKDEIKTSFRLANVGTNTIENVQSQIIIEELNSLKASQKFDISPGLIISQELIISSPTPHKPGTYQIKIQVNKENEILLKKYSYFMIEETETPVETEEIEIEQPVETETPTEQEEITEDEELAMKEIEIPEEAKEDDDFFQEEYSLKIKEYQISPEKINAGDMLKIEIDLLNNGNIDLDDLTIKFEIPDLNIGTTEYITTIWAGRKRSTDDMYLKIPSNTRTGTYKFEINVKSYNIDETITGSLRVNSEIEECKGCLIDKLCIPTESRFAYRNKISYCAYSGNVEIQKEDFQTCNENYECKSNYCNEKRCEPLKEKLDQAVSIEDIKETVEEMKKESSDDSIWEKIVDFVKNIF